VNCDPLPNTGLDTPVLLVLAIAVVCLLLGLGLLLRAKRSANSAGATLLLVILAVGSGALLTATPSSPAFAAPSDCNHHHSGDSDSDEDDDWDENTEPNEPENWLTITQTSPIDDLAPNVAPTQIAGSVVNNGPDSTYITAIAVEIVGVVQRVGSVAGTCDASDYVLLEQRMYVGRTLEPDGGTSAFSGATIGFNNKASNQDACQGARVELRYTTTA